MLSIFFDVEAAFDKVWHAGLIYKLAKLKTPHYILRFFIVFLSNRSIKVKVGASYSDEIACTCGVPQGACVSPTLYSIYGNDAPKRLTKNDEMTLLFADDSEYSLLFKKKSKRIEKKAQKFVNELEAWSKKWRSTLATHKCNYIVFSKSNKKENFSLILNNDTIPRCNSIKYLGLTLDERLNFNEHIMNLRIECRDRLSALKIVAHKSWRLSKETLKQIYHSIVRSKIEYSFILVGCLGSGVWEKLRVIQNNALRIIYGKKREFGNAQLHELSGEISLEERLIELKPRYLKKSNS